MVDGCVLLASVQTETTDGTHMPRFSANISILFNELPFLDRFAAAKAAGFDAVECWFPGEHPRAEITSRLDALGLTMVGINTTAGSAGEWGLAAVPGREAAFRDSLLLALDQAASFKCRAIHVMAGLATPATYDSAWRTYVENLTYAVQQARGTGVQLLVEPLNHHDRPGYALSTVQQAAALVGDGLDDLRIMFDCYHVARAGGPVLTQMQEVWPLIGHIQIAGVPDRGSPAEGTVDYREIFAEIDRLGWPGWVGAEYQAAGPSADSLGWMRATA